MRGWTRDGREVELTPWQAEAVEQILAARGEGRRVTIQRGRAFGWTTVQATVARLAEMDGDPRPGPRYETAHELTERTGKTDTVVCTDCGAFVMNVAAHDRFHLALSGQVRTMTEGT